MLSSTFSDFISGMEVTDHRYYDTKIKNLHLQECSLKNRSLEFGYFARSINFNVTVFILYTVSWRYERDYLHAPCQFRYFASYYVLYYSNDEEILESFIPRLHFRYK